MTVADQMLAVHNLSGQVGRPVLIPLYDLAGRRMSLRVLRFVGDGFEGDRWGFAIYVLLNEPLQRFEPGTVRTLEFRKHTDLGVVVVGSGGNDGEGVLARELVLPQAKVLDGREDLLFLAFTVSNHEQTIYCPIGGSSPLEQADSAALMGFPAGTAEDMPDRVFWTPGAPGGAPGDFATRAVPAISLRDSLGALLMGSL